MSDREKVEHKYSIQYYVYESDKLERFQSFFMHMDIHFVVLDCWWSSIFPYKLSGSRYSEISPIDSQRNSKEIKLDHTERYHPRRSEAGIGGNVQLIESAEANYYWVELWVSLAWEEPVLLDMADSYES